MVRERGTRAGGGGKEYSGTQNRGNSRTLYFLLGRHDFCARKSGGSEGFSWFPVVASTVLEPFSSTDYTCDSHLQTTIMQRVPLETTTTTKKMMMMKMMMRTFLMVKRRLVCPT